MSWPGWAAAPARSDAAVARAGNVVRRFPCQPCSASPHCGSAAWLGVVPRSPHWVNTPVLMEALDRYEQGRLPRSMQLWVEAVLELEHTATAPLRPHC